MKIIKLIIIVLLSSHVFGQKLPNLSDSILIFKYNNYYQLVNSTDTLAIFYYADSTVKAKGNIQNKKRNGSWNTYYPNGQIKTNAYITDSSFYGKWIFYYTNGNIKAKGKFFHTYNLSDSSSLILKESGKWKYWYESGELMLKTFYSPFRTKNYAKYGKFVAYYQSGIKKTKGEYYKGRKIGNWVYYYKNGEKKLVSQYQYNEKFKDQNYPIGLWTYYNEAGTLNKTELYKNGKLVKTNHIK